MTQNLKFYLEKIEVSVNMWFFTLLQPNSLSTVSGSLSQLLVIRRPHRGVLLL